MPYLLRVETGLVHVYWHGCLTRADLESIGGDLRRTGEELQAVPDVLHTFDGVTGRDFQPIVVYMVSLLRKRVRIPLPVRSAMVAATAEGQTMARLFKVLNRTHNLEMEVFATEAAARRWLAKNRNEARAASG